MIARFIETWANFCLTYRKSILLALVAITAVAASALPGVRFDNALEIWFVENDPALLAHRELIDKFGSDELVVIGVEAPDVFAPETLEVIDRVTRAVEEAPHVEKVFSLTNIESMTGRDDMLDISDLIEFPLDPEQLPAVRERALANELYVGNVTSAEGDFACIVARLPHRTDDFDYKVEAIEAIRAILAGEEGVQFYLSGGPALDERFFQLSQRDSEVTTTLMLGCLIVTLWLLLRSVSGVILSFSTVVVSTVWAMGWIVLAGVRVNMLTTLLPPLLLAVGVAGSMHVIVDYQSRCSQGLSKDDALRTVYRELMTPLFLTSLTTAIGMLSLLVSRIQGVRDFGAFAALGVAGAFLLTVTLVPIALSYLPVPTPRSVRSSTSARSERLLEGLHRQTMRHGHAIVAVSAVLLALGVAGGTQVRAESAFMEYFKDGEPIKLATRRIEKAISGTMTLEVIVDSGEPEGIKDPRVLRSIADLQDFLEADQYISASQSITDYMKDLRRAFFENDQAHYRLPETREEAAQYLLLYEMDAPDGDIKDFVTFDYREARVSARVDVTSSNDAAALVEKTEAYIAEHFPPGVSATVTGVTTLYANMEEYLRASLIKGFSIALVAIFIVFCIQMRSVSLGAIAMIPNVSPIVLCLGIMGASGILLDTMTAMVASIAIGLAVDDSIHFVSRARMHLNAGRTMRTALRDTTVEIGRALVYTSLALSAGFGVMLFASFRGTVYFGLLCMLTTIFALVADLVLLPVVLNWYAGRKAGVRLFASPEVQHQAVAAEAEAAALER